MFRGHEKVLPGFQGAFEDDPHARIFTLFSAGGRDNADLPKDSTYRDVTPMALTLTYERSGSEPGAAKITPWAPDYATYNDPERNAFFKLPPEIEMRS
jgi:hypothetical protein